MHSPAIFNVADLWRSYPSKHTGLALLALIGGFVVAGTASVILRLPKSAATTDGAPPPLPAMVYRSVAPEEAVRINNQIPIVGTANPARPFVSNTANPVARRRALDCLASAVYYEAGQESADGQRAVAQVILNRVRHPAFPASVCGVVYQGSTRRTGCQFTFTCDGSMARGLARDAWDRARRVAAAALDGSVYAAVGNATHYHAYYVVPYWASSLVKTAMIGAHLFYRWSGGWGQPLAFAQAYSGHEADPLMLRADAMSVIRIPAVAAPIVTTVAENSITGPDVAKLDGAIFLDDTDAARVQMLFSSRADTRRRKSDQDPHLERIETSENIPSTLNDHTVSKPAKVVAGGTAPAGTSNKVH